MLKYIFITLVLVILGGTIGYVLIENVSLFDALYMTIISITTVGFGEIFPMSKLGREFTILLILCGVGVLLVTFGVLTQIAVEGSLRRVIGRKRLEKQIGKLSHHYIVCGSGRIGRYLLDELIALKVPLVVIEHDPVIVEELEERGLFVLHGDATQEEVLEKANIAGAHGLIVTVGTDAEAVFIILSARNLNPDLFIIARALDEANERKLRQAGANRVVAPYRLIGKRIAHSLLHPAVTDMFDLLMFRDEMDFGIEGIEVYSNSPIAGLKLKDSGIRQKLGLIIIGIQKADGNIVFNPEPEEKIMPGDTLLTIGERLALRQLEDWLCCRVSD